MLATMNNRDAHLLSAMSEAFTRRFAIINIGLANTNQIQQIIRNLIHDSLIPTEYKKIMNELGKILSEFLGPALIIDLCKFVIEWHAVQSDTHIQKVFEEGLQSLIYPSASSSMDDLKSKIEQFWVDYESEVVPEEE